MSGTLFIVATPIGNLGDLSERALKTLREVQAVGAEDTRVTGVLLKSAKISTELISIHEHSDIEKVNRFLNRLEHGDLAYVTDAGTPAISDPGYKIVAEARKRGFNVEAIPGPSALVTAISISGFPSQPFTFLGFPPVKKGRIAFFERVSSTDHMVVLYESKHRIHKTLEQLPMNRQLFVGRELTKMHESHYFGTSQEILSQLEKESRGEFVIVLSPI